MLPVIVRNDQISNMEYINCIDFYITENNFNITRNIPKNHRILFYGFQLIKKIKK